VTWGKFRTGSRVWHWIEPAAPRKTRCGRAFPQAPVQVQRSRPQVSDEEVCHRCVAMVAYARTLAADLEEPKAAPEAEPRR
jgi:hypothetical protein